MTWQPSEEQTLARMDPDAQPVVEAEARVHAAVVLLKAWLQTHDPTLLDAAGDIVTIARWWSEP